jgi:CHAT domain-containing protein/tetratricopeptide (TPR) repeat protein
MGAADRPGKPAALIGRAAAALVALAAATILSAWGAPARGDVAGDLAAARAHQDHSRWAQSESLATAVLARLEGDPKADSLQMADALYLFARARRRQVGYADGSALRAATRCLGIRVRRLGPDHLDVATAHLEIGRSLAGADRADSALAEVRRSIEIRTAHLAPNDTLIAESWDQLAVIHRDSHDFRAALDDWNRAIDIRVHANGPDHPEVARLLAQTGVPWMELGDLARARDVLERSLAIFARNGDLDYPGRWIPLNILSDLEQRSGNDARSLDLLQEALRVVSITRGENSREALTVRGNMAVTLGNFCDFEGVKAIGTRLLPAMVSQYGPDHPRTVGVRLGLAYASGKTGDTTLALRQFGELEALLATRGEATRPMLSTIEIMQAELLYREGRDRESRKASERAIQNQLSSREPNGSVLADAHQLLMYALESIGDTTALDSARRELARIAETYVLEPSEYAGKVPYATARAERRLGRREEALHDALEAERQQREHLRLNLLALPDRLALQLTFGQEAYLELVLDLCRGDDPKRVETGWDRLVRSRGLVRAVMARRRLPRGFESDTAVAGALARWTEAQRVWAQRLVSASGSRDSATRVAVGRLSASAEDAEGAYARALASHRVTVTPADVGISDVRSRLQPGQALVAFYESRGSLSGWLRDDTSRVVAFVARAGAGPVDRIELGRTSILQTAIDAWRERLAATPRTQAGAADRAERECRRWGREVRALTWDRVASRIAGATDVFVVGDGPLLDLSWQALPDGAHGYLVEAGPRLHLLNAERELVEPRVAVNSSSMLAIGAPDFGRGVRETSGSPPLLAAAVRASAGPCAGGLPTFVPLPGTGAEAEAVASAWRGDPHHHALVLVGEEASEEAFKRNARGQAIIHLATHGVVTSDTCASGGSGLRGVGEIGPLAQARNARRPADGSAAPAARPPAPSPWMSRRVWLAFTGASRAYDHVSDENEGLLTAEEVVTLDLDGTDWVVLSACHSALADAWSREGSLGMRRAFELAGARTVIASQWSVEDEATTEWMRALYAARARGATTGAEAVESASRAVLAARRAAHRSTHPFFWAAFTASGE